VECFTEKIDIQTAGGTLKHQHIAPGVALVAHLAAVAVLAPPLVTAL